MPLASCAVLSIFKQETNTSKIMKKITTFLPAIAFALLLSAALMAGIPPVPPVAEAPSYAKDKEKEPEEPKRIFDRRIAWGPMPEAAATWNHVLAQYGE